MSVKIENATTKLTVGDIDGTEFIPLGKTGWVVSKAVMINNLKTWLSEEYNIISQLNSSVEVTDTGTGIITFTVDGTVLLNIDLSDGIYPETDNILDLGSATKQFKNLYVNATAHIDQLELDDGGQTVTAVTTTVDGGSLDTELPTAAAVYSAIGASSAARWFAMTAGTRTADNTFTSTTLIAEGTPIYWTDTLVNYYGIIDTVSAGTPNTYTILGYPMSASATGYYYGNPELVYTERFHIDGAFSYDSVTAATSAGALYDYLNMKFHYIWEKPNARVVAMKVNSFTDDSTLDPTINLANNQGASYNNVFDSNLSIDSSGANTGVTATASYSILSYGDILDFTITAGDTGNATDLDITLIIVLV